MRDDLIKAKQALSEGHACAVCRGGELYTADGRGIAPLLSLIEQLKDLHGYSAADRVIGSAAAYLMAEAGIEEAYAATTSEGALRIFAKNGVTVSYSTLTDKIMNRRGDGLCPMEEKALTMDSSEGAYRIFRARLDQISK